MVGGGSVHPEYFSHWNISLVSSKLVQDVFVVSPSVFSFSFSQCHVNVKEHESSEFLGLE